jgi:hypothetical protein
MTYTMGRPIGGLALGQRVLARPAGDRYRDMYGGAVVIEVDVDGKSCAVALDSADAFTFAKHLQLAAEDSRAAYALALARRKETS